MCRHAMKGEKELAMAVIREPRPGVSPSGARVCPACGAREPIGAGEDLWPADWVCGKCGAGLATQAGIVRLAPKLDGTSEGFNANCFDGLAAVESGHFWFESRNTLIAWLMRRFIPEPRRILEVGCGTGFVLSTIRQVAPLARVSGSELHANGLAIARRRHGGEVELIQMDARAIGLEAVLDAVCAFDVLEHIPEDERVLAEMSRALRPGGILMATVPQHPWLWSEADDAAHHQRRYRIGELPAKVRAAGFEVVYRDSFVSLLLPLMAASRLAVRARPKAASDASQHIEREFEVAPWLNGAFLALQRVEHALRRAGLRLPFGGSQVVVARKLA